MYGQKTDIKQEIRARTKSTMIFLSNGLCEENINEIFDFVGATLTENLEDKIITYFKAGVEYNNYRITEAIGFHCSVCDKYFAATNQKTRASIEASHCNTKVHINNVNRKLADKKGHKLINDYGIPTELVDIIYDYTIKETPFVFNEKIYKKTFRMGPAHCCEYNGKFTIMTDEDEIYGVLARN